MQKPTLALIDATGMIRRVYEAIPGEPGDARSDGALKSSMGSFKAAISACRPTHVLAAFDYGGRTWRHDLDEGYKANRRALDDALKSRLPAFRDSLKAAGVASYSVQGYEADDIIGTVAVKASTRGFKVIVVSFDKDLCRLVSEDVIIYDHFSKEWRNSDWVRLKLGVNPSQVTDYLAMVGDKDEVPGIPRIGKKTAVGLLKDYQSLQDVYSNLHKLPPSLSKALEEGREISDLSFRLASLSTDVPIGLTPKQMLYASV